LELEVFRKVSISVEYAYGSAGNGDIAEFGTFRGHTASVIAKTMARCDRKWPQREPKKLLLFDSFQGLPAPETAADEAVMIDWHEGSLVGLSKHQLSSLCSRYLPQKRICIYDGWFKDTVQTIPSATRLVMLHIDCDLYQSTIDILDHCLRERIISEGAIILFDDWNIVRADPNLGEGRAWREMAEKYEIEFSDGGDYAWGGHKLIIHSYA
jgi:hypothetical protein